jgi:hypothetical protein
VKKIIYGVIVLSLVLVGACKKNLLDLDDFELDFQGEWEFKLTESGKTITRQYEFVGNKSAGQIFCNQKVVGTYGAGYSTVGYDTLYTVSNYDDEIDNSGIWAEIYYGNITDSSMRDSGNYTRTNGDSKPDVSGTFTAKKI